MKEFEIYANRICSCSVCSSLGKKETIERTNEENSTEMDDKWTMANSDFADGTVNPHPCESSPDTHKHYLLVC